MNNEQLTIKNGRDVAYYTDENERDVIGAS